MTYIDPLLHRPSFWNAHKLRLKFWSTLLNIIKSQLPTYNKFLIRHYFSHPHSLVVLEYFLVHLEVLFFGYLWLNLWFLFPISSMYMVDGLLFLFQFLYVHLSPLFFTIIFSICSIIDAHSLQVLCHFLQKLLCKQSRLSFCWRW